MIFITIYLIVDAHEAIDLAKKVKSIILKHLEGKDIMNG